MNIIDKDMLKAATLLAYAAYDGIDGAKEFKCWYTSAKAYLVSGPDFDVLVFAGTKEPLDWLIDAMVWSVNYGGYRTHAGFAWSHKSIWKKIKPHLRPSRRLIVAGHSLGGANADITCNFIQDFEDAHMITNGKPNVYLKGQEPKRSFLKTHLSVVSGSDAITRLPKVRFGPDKNQDMLYYGNDDVDYINPDPEFVSNDFSYADFLSDHSMIDLYIPRMKRFLENMK